jgi:hypothetical protein
VRRLEGRLPRQVVLVEAARQLQLRLREAVGERRHRLERWVGLVDGDGEEEGPGGVVRLQERQRPVDDLAVGFAVAPVGTLTARVPAGPGAGRGGGPAPGRALVGGSRVALTRGRALPAVGVAQRIQGGAEVRLPEVGRGVAGVSKDVPHGTLAACEVRRVAVEAVDDHHLDFVGVEPRLHRRAGGDALPVAGVVVGEAHVLAREAVKVGCVRMRVEAALAPVLHLVADEQDDVRSSW